MPITEAQRADLYTGLAEVLGPDRAENLMAQLPRFDPAEVVTKSHLSEEIGRLREEVGGLREEMTGQIAQLRSGLAAVNQRLDRLFLALLVGMFGMVAALIGVIFRLS